MNSHLSEEEISGWIAGVRSEEAEGHMRDCPQCAGEAERTQNALLLFKDSGYQVAEYWQKQSKTRAVWKPVRWTVAALAAAGVILAVALLHRPLAPQVQPMQEVFLRVPYVVPPAPYERTEVIRMDVPVAALISAGFKMNFPAADSVPADVLVGQDGRPLAVGFPENKQ